MPSWKPLHLGILVTNQKNDSIESIFKTREPRGADIKVQQLLMSVGEKWSNFFRGGGGQRIKERVFWKLKCSWKSSFQRMKHESWLKKIPKINGFCSDWWLGVISELFGVIRAFIRSAGLQMRISMFEYQQLSLPTPQKKIHEATSRCFRRNLGRHRLCSSNRLIRLNWLEGINYQNIP